MNRYSEEEPERHCVSLISEYYKTQEVVHNCEFCAVDTDPSWIIAEVTHNGFKVNCQKTKLIIDKHSLKPDQHNLLKNTVTILKGCRIKVKVGYNDQIVETLITVDTGATISCVSRYVLEKLFPKMDVRAVEQQMTLKSANGSNIPIEGIIDMKLHIGSIMERIRFAILKQGDTFLLSHPDLRKFQAILYLTRKTMTVGQLGQNQELIKEKEDDSRHWSLPQHRVEQVTGQTDPFNQFFNKPLVSRRRNFIKCKVITIPHWYDNEIITIVLQPDLHTSNSHILYHDIAVYNCDCYLQKKHKQCHKCKTNGPLAVTNLYTIGNICINVHSDKIKGSLCPVFVAVSSEEEFQEPEQVTEDSTDSQVRLTSSNDSTNSVFRKGHEHQVNTISSDELFFHQDEMKITPPAYVYENNKLLMETSSLTVKKAKHKLQDQVTIQELEQALNCQYCAIRHPDNIYCNLKDANCLTRRKFHEKVYGKLTLPKCKIISPDNNQDWTQEKHLFLIVQIDRLEDYKCISFLQLYRKEIESFVQEFRDSEQQMKLYKIENPAKKYYFFICLYQRQCTLIVIEILYEIEKILSKIKGRKRLAFLNHKEVCISQHQFSTVFHECEVDIVLLNIIQHQVRYVNPKLNVSAQEAQSQSIQQTVDQAETSSEIKQKLFNFLTEMDVKEEGKESLFSTHTNEINHFHSDTYPYQTFIVHLPIKEQYKNYIPAVPKERYIAADLREQAKEMLQSMVDSQILTPRYTNHIAQSVYVARKLPISKEEWVAMGRPESDWFPNTCHPTKVSLRLTQNFQDVNRKFETITYNQESPLDQLRSLTDNVNVITIIDVTAAYHTIVLSKESTDLLGFFSGIPDFYNTLVYNRLAMGLTPSKAILDLCLEHTFRPKPEVIVTDKPHTRVPAEARDQSTDSPLLSDKSPDHDNTDGNCDTQYTEGQQLSDTLVFNSKGRMPRKCIKRWSDNIMVVSNSDEEHLQDVMFTLSRMRDHGWKLKLKKLSLYKKTPIEIYGYIYDIQTGILRPGIDKIKSLRESPFPSTITQLRSFLGSLNFVANFLPIVSTAVQKLHSLCKKHNFDWDEEARRAYEEVMTLLSLEKLIYNKRPSYDLDIHACVDASSEKSAHVIYQIDKQGNPHILTYGHNVFPVQHQAYGSTLNEVFAVMHCIKDLESYQYRLRPTYLITDARVLCLLVMGGKTNTRLLRIKMFIQNLTWLVPIFQRNTSSEIAIADYFSRNFGIQNRKFTQKLPGEAEEQMAGIIGKKIDPKVKIPMHSVMMVIDYLLNMPTKKLDTVMDESVRFENGKVLFEIDQNISPEKEKDRTTLQSIIEHQQTLQKKTKSKKKVKETDNPEAKVEEIETPEATYEDNADIKNESVNQVITRRQAAIQQQSEQLAERQQFKAVAPAMQDPDLKYSDNVLQFMNPRSNIPSKIVVEEEPVEKPESLNAFQRFYKHLIYNTPHLDLKGFREAQRLDPRFSEIIQECEKSEYRAYGNSKSKKLYFMVDNILFCSEFFANAVIYKVAAPSHTLFDSVVFGHRQQHHCSAQQLYNQFTKIFDTYNLMKICKMVIDQCQICTAARPNYGGVVRRDLPKSPTLLSEPRICVSIDELAIPAGDHILKCLLAIDVFSNYMYIEFLNAPLTSKRFEEFIRRIKLMYGSALCYLHTDNDIRLENAQISSMCEELGIFKISTLAYSSKSLFAEVGNKMLLDVLRLELLARDTPVAMFKSIIEALVVSLNESPFYESPSISPYSLFFGCHPKDKENIGFIENNNILDKEEHFRLTLYFGTALRKIRSSCIRRRQLKLKEIEQRNKRDNYQDKIVPGSVVMLRNRDQLRGGIFKTVPIFAGRWLVIKRTASAVLLVPLATNTVDEYVEQQENSPEKTQTKLAVKADISQVKLLSSNVFIGTEDDFYPHWATKRRSPRPLYIHQHSGGYNLDDWNTTMNVEEPSMYKAFCVMRKQVFQTLDEMATTTDQPLKGILNNNQMECSDLRTEQIRDVAKAALRLYKPDTRSICFNAEVSTVRLSHMEDMYWADDKEQQ